MAADFEMLDLRLEGVDFLTNIPNRGTLEAKLVGDLQLGAGKDLQYSIILFDIDYFKAINDLLGHSQGDEVLRDVGRLLQSFDDELACYTGMYGRWGGEEFLIALPHATEDDAASLAEKVRKAVAAYAFHDVKTGNALEQQVTVSLGVNTADLADIKTAVCLSEKARSVVERADMALSFAKLLGRDRVAVFSDYLKQELNYLGIVRKFYFAAANKETEAVCSAMARSRNLAPHPRIRAIVSEHSRVLREHVNPRDTRTQSVFADNLYRDLRTLPCEEKMRVIRFMDYFLRGRYD